MTKLEELKAAYEASTPGEWEQKGYDDIGRYVQTLDAGEVCSMKRGKFKQIQGLEYRSNAIFIALAHNMMPLLLNAATLLRQYDRLLAQVLDSTCYELDEDQLTTVNEAHQFVGGLE